MPPSGLQSGRSWSFLTDPASTLLSVPTLAARLQVSSLFPRICALLLAALAATFTAFLRLRFSRACRS